jgi:hypothetical protein
MPVPVEPSEIISLTVTDSEGFELGVVDGDRFELVAEENYPIELAAPDQLVVIGGNQTRPQPVAFVVPTRPWVINHNLGYQPQVAVVDNLGNQVLAETTITNSQIVINHNQPATGSVIYL